MVIWYHISATIQFLTQLKLIVHVFMDHGWMYGRSGRGGCRLHASDLAVILTCSSNLFLGIWLKRVRGAGGGVVVCIEFEVCAYHVKVEGRGISLKLGNRHHNYRIVSLDPNIACVRLNDLIFYALSHYPLAAFRTKCFNRLGSHWCGWPWGHINYFRYFWL